MNVSTKKLFKMDAIDVYKMVIEGDIITKFPDGFWRQKKSKENAQKIIRWLIEEKLKLSDEQLKEVLSINLFDNNGLSGMLQTCFNRNAYICINEVYPNRFKKSDFKNYS